MGIQQILKLKQNKDNIVYQILHKREGRSTCLVLINKTQMPKCKKLSSKFHLGEGLMGRSQTEQQI